MCKVSFEVFQDLTFFVAQAELANRNKENGGSAVFLEKAQALIEKNGLTDHINIEKIPHDSCDLLRLSGADGHGISYTIQQDGIIFPEFRDGP